MPLSCPALNGVGLRGGGISATMKDSGLRRHSTHSIIEGERRVLQSSAPPSASLNLAGGGGGWRERNASSFPLGPKSPRLLGSHPSLVLPSPGYFVGLSCLPAEGERCHEAGRKAGRPAI